MDDHIVNENSRMARFRTFIEECRRFLRITKKPDRIEFITIVKISALGIAVVGLLGFTLQMIKTYLFQ